MAGGPLWWHSASPTTSGVMVQMFSNSASGQEWGLGISESFTADAIWRLFYHMPPTLPTGTGKIRLVGLASSGGTVTFNPKWASIAATEAPSSVTVNAEGSTSLVLTNGNYGEAKVALDATSLVGGEIVRMDLTIEDVGTTIPGSAILHAVIIWE